MNKYNNLLIKIANELNIKKGNNEPELQYKSRIIYSAISRLGYSSLWDKLEDDIPVSIIHFKQRIKNVLNSYLKMYPEVRSLFPTDDSVVSDKLFELFYESGIIYHSPERISPSIKKQAVVGEIVFWKGHELAKLVSISGAGAYTLNSENAELSNIYDMFGLSNKNLSNVWAHYSEQNNWAEFHSINDYEYLRTVPPFTLGYWQTTPDKGDVVSVMRSKNIVSRQYYIYRKEGKQLFYSQLPSWIMEGRFYNYITCGCLVANGKLPENEYHVEGAITYLDIKYRLPKAEQNFINLYSWAKNTATMESDFSRIFATEVFFAIKEILEKTGYKFKEV